MPFSPMGLPGAALPTTWWNAGFRFHWDWRKTRECFTHRRLTARLNPGTVYKQYGSDTISFVPFIFGPTGFYTSNLDVARQVASSSRGRSFIKPETASGALL